MEIGGQTVPERNPAAAQAALERVQAQQPNSAEAARMATVQTTGNLPPPGSMAQPQVAAAQAVAATTAPPSATEQSNSQALQISAEALPPVHIARDASTIDTLTALSKTMSQPGLSKAAVQSLYDIHSQIFDYYRQSNSVWVNKF